MDGKVARGQKSGVRGGRGRRRQKRKADTWKYDWRRRFCVQQHVTIKGKLQNIYTFKCLYARKEGDKRGPGSEMREKYDDED